MVKTLALLIVAGSLAACGSSNPKATPEPAPATPQNGCYQAEWQAETNPVINKRSGPDGLDKYETQTSAKEHGCP
jgi:predicted small lipoprotein YifL